MSVKLTMETIRGWREKVQTNRATGSVLLLSMDETDALLSLAQQGLSFAPELYQQGWNEGREALLKEQDGNLKGRAATAVEDWEDRSHASSKNIETLVAVAKIWLAER